MEALTLSLFGFIIVSFVLSTWKMYKSRLRLPPGPTPLPLVGNILQGSTKLYDSYRKFHKQYGPVFTIWMGTSPVVVLCGYEVTKDALINNSKQFSFRGSLPISERLANGYGIICTNGDAWQQIRRFTLTTLRNFGMGDISIEQRIQEEASHLIQAIKDIDGRTFDPLTLIGRSVNNIINLTMFGRRWNYEDEELLKLLGTTNNLLNFIRVPLGVTYAAFHKIMQYLPGPHHKIFRDCEDMKNFIREQINLHMETLDVNSPRDFIDCFLIKAKKDKMFQADTFCIDNLVVTVFELFVAGTETTTNTLQFFLLVMIKYPQVQDRIQQEIDTVIGTHRLPELSDRIQMPYTNAVIHEIIRFLDLVPFALPHKVIEDTPFQGFNILKGTTIFPMIGSSLHDPAYWETPDEFNPGHFMDKKGQFCMNDAFIPFSAGRRICPGEGLARKEIFLFFTSLLQKFTLRAVNHPDSFNLNIMRRDFRNDGLKYNLKAYPRIHATES
ncbi:cytochrome P450 2C20-like [Pelodytes ibericus]